MANLGLNETMSTKHSTIAGVTKIKPTCGLSSFVAVLHLLHHCVNEHRGGLWTLRVEEACTDLPAYSLGRHQEPWKEVIHVGLSRPEPGIALKQPIVGHKSRARVNGIQGQYNVFSSSLLQVRSSLYLSTDRHLLPLYILPCGPGLVPKYRHWRELPDQKKPSRTNCA